MQIAEGKITVPELPTSFVLRDDLLDRLDQAAPGQLVVVIAPPGFGKTTLLSSWVLPTTRRASDQPCSPSSRRSPACHRIAPCARSAGGEGMQRGLTSSMSSSRRSLPPPPD